MFSFTNLLAVKLTHISKANGDDGAADFARGVEDLLAEAHPSFELVQFVLFGEFLRVYTHTHAHAHTDTKREKERETGWNSDTASNTSYVCSFKYLLLCYL